MSCIDNTISVTVNGDLLTTVEDTGLNKQLSGDVALYIETFDEIDDFWGVKALFDNFYMEVLP